MSEALQMTIKNESIREDVPVERQCPSCWLDKGRINEGTIPRKDASGVLRYFCKEHEHGEMPHFCPKCGHPLIEMISHHYCYECGEIVSINGPHETRIIKKKTPTKSKDPSKTVPISLDEQIIELLKQGPRTRSELVKKLKTPRTTLHAHLKALEKKKIISHSFKHESKAGRPRTIWNLIEKNKSEKQISRRSARKPRTKSSPEEKCEKHPECIFFIEGKCRSEEKISFIWCDGSFIKFDENPAESDSAGSKRQSTKNEK